MTNGKWEGSDPLLLSDNGNISILDTKLKTWKILTNGKNAMVYTFTDIDITTDNNGLENCVFDATVQQGQHLSIMHLFPRNSKFNMKGFFLYPTLGSQYDAKN